MENHAANHGRGAQERTTGNVTPRNPNPVAFSGNKKRPGASGTPGLTHYSRKLHREGRPGARPYSRPLGHYGTAWYSVALPCYQGSPRGSAKMGKAGSTCHNSRPLGH